MYVLACRMKAPVSITGAFAVFESPYNLARITPPWLHFRITTPEQVRTAKGTEMEYQIRWLGLPVSWKTIITEYNPPVLFEDKQEKGPYTVWRHRHTFESVQGGTIISDEVQYELPFGLLGRLAHRMLVARQLRNIFEFRQRALVRLLGGEARKYEFLPIVIREL